MKGKELAEYYYRENNRIARELFNRPYYLLSLSEMESVCQIRNTENQNERNTEK